MKILFITLSNIGDCVLTLPVLDACIEKYPQAEFSVICGEKARDVFAGNHFIKKIIIYNRKAPLGEKWRFVQELYREKYDLVMDLRNTILPFALGIKRLNKLFGAGQGVLHMKDRHLSKMQNAKCKMQNVDAGHFFSGVSDKHEKYKNYVLVAPGSRSHLKRWSVDGFAQVCERLIGEKGLNIVFTGDSEDKAMIGEIIAKMSKPAVNLCARTTFGELVDLVKGAKLVICADSAVLHLASYLEKGIVSIFGPTDEKKYGPWSGNCVIVKKEVFCRPCEKAQCRLGTIDCMSLIKPEDVLRAAEKIIYSVHQSPARPNDPPDRSRAGAVGQVASHQLGYKRILIVRTDRIGDVVLSTPVLKALRDNFPCAYLAMMVSPFTQELAKGNPYLDEVIVYDKDKEHKGFLNSLKFALVLSKKKFDLAIILHSTNRVNMIAYSAGIKERIGYSRRMGFLLTKNIPYAKYKGEKHEVEYNLDLLRALRLTITGTMPFIPTDNQAEIWADEIFASYKIDKSKDKIIVLHPSASCISRMWPLERFAEVAESVIKKYNAQVIIVSGANDIALTEKLCGMIKYSVLNLGGKTNLMQLASILRRVTLMVSSDSGPVHIAVGCGLPVVVLFGRAQPGLGPKRWGPLGVSDIVLHKKTGCVTCLAHECENDFACLKSITVSDVLSAVDGIIKV